MPTPQRERESIEIAAPPAVVYDLLADITRMGEWSPECYRCVWLDGASAAEVGSRFRGYNRLGPYRWERTAVITAADRGRNFAQEAAALARDLRPGRPVRNPLPRKAESSEIRSSRRSRPAQPPTCP
jgi:Polyketide cyclase / dehydrase and lipid transport